MEKFLFDTCFEGPEATAAVSAPKPDAEPPEPEVPPTPPAPTFSEEELNAARQESFLAGKQDGLKEAMNATESAAVTVLEGIPGQLDALFTQWEDSRLEHKALALRVATAVTRKLFPRLAATAGLQEVEQVVGECLERLPKEPRLVVRMADGLLDTVRGRIEKTAERSGYEGRLVFLEDPDLGPGDVRVEWADGGAERNSDALWSSIDEVLNRGLIIAAMPDKAQADPTSAPTMTSAPETVPSPTDPSPAPAATAAQVQAPVQAQADTQAQAQAEKQTA